jgi:hypothetical protein
MRLAGLDSRLQAGSCHNYESDTIREKLGLQDETLQVCEGCGFQCGSAEID